MRVALFAVLCVAMAGARKGRGGDTGRERGGRRCKVPLCAACTSSGSCSRCVEGYGFTAGKKRCEACAPGCRRCDAAGPGRCDACIAGHALHDERCEPCAANCQSCTKSGPGECDKGGCKRRHVLITSAGIRGVVDAAPPPGWDAAEDGAWEPESKPAAKLCAPCSVDCYKCVDASPAGCVQCDSVMYTQSGEQGCALSLARLALLVALFVRHQRLEPPAFRYGIGQSQYR